MEDYLDDPRLQQSEGHPATSLQQLLLIEFFWRQRQQGDVSENEYLQRFPGYEDVVREAFAEHRQREQERQSSGPTRRVRAGEPDKQLLANRYERKHLLGRGSFGEVYLHRDTLLGRDVALKTARRDQSATQAAAGAIRTNRPHSLTEAQKLSTLQIDGVPRVFDVFETEIDQQQTLCMTFEFIDGETLADQLAGRRTVPDYNATALQMAELASIVQQIHAHHMCHWDLKPSNIMVDKSGKLWIVDFGLAVFTSERHLYHGKSVGTTPYMSPEQVGAEPSRDGRSDIWSLGAIFYQLLTGKPPFSGGGAEVIRDAIRNGTLPLPRQIVPQTPPQLERICLKCLARDPAARYQSASELATELRNWHRVESELLALPVAAWRNVELPGLRAFGPKHKRLFLQLLPGIREENGLPQSINFWKQLAENRYESESAVPVALLTGVSGCGKSSLMKAGVLPVLERHVIPIYVEAAVEGTEAALQRKLRERFPTLTQTGSLEELLRALRDGAFLPDDQKLLLVMDQFEQVLASENSVDWCRMRDALRQCDGLRLQAVVMTRSDFQEAASLFFEGLGQKLNENTNSVTLRLFEPEHARHVMHLLGLALGRLPEHVTEGSLQALFLNQAIAELSQDGRVNSVRLAVLAEMLKNREWEPATLRAIGGVRGVGVTFLEESFAVADAPLTHRRHLEAVRRVLKFLLPAVDSNIVGAVQSTSELRRVAGYDQRASDFESLMRILDTELRLITPIDLTKNSAVTSETASDQRFYKLTHDFLVPSIREWIAKKQQQTREGRAELALERRTELWSSRTEDRQLPSLWEYGQIRLYVKGRYWTQEQRQMMLVAGKRHRQRLLLGGTTLSALMCMLLFVWLKIAGDREQLRVDGLREQARKLAEAIPGRRTAELDAGLRELQPLQSYALPVLQEMSKKESSLGFDARLHLTIARLQLGDADEGLIQTVQQLALQAAPEQLPPLTQLLQPWADKLAGEWRAIAGKVEEPVKRRLHAACLLAGWEAGQSSAGVWSHPATAKFVAESLSAENPLNVVHYQNVLRPQGIRLVVPLASLLAVPEQVETARTNLMGLIVAYAKDNVKLLTQILLDADPVADRALFPLLQPYRRQAIDHFHDVLDQTLSPKWPDNPLDPAWAKVDGSVKATVETAHGMLAERYAFCLDIPLSQLLPLAESLRASGYRPTRLRPHAGQLSPDPRMSAVWVRDGRKWLVHTSVERDKLPREDENAEREGLLLEDLVMIPGGGPQSGWLTLWSEGVRNGEQRCCEFDLSPEGKYAYLKTYRPPDRDYWSQLSLHAYADPTQNRRYAAIWSNRTEARPDLQLSWSGVERIDRPQRDLTIGPRTAPELTDPRAIYREQLLDWQKQYRGEGPQQPRMRFDRARAMFYTGALEQALFELDWLHANQQVRNPLVLQFRTLALAQLGRGDDAQVSFTEFQETNPNRARVDYVAIQLAIWENDIGGAQAAIDGAVVSHQQSGDDLFYISCAAALCGRACRQRGAAADATDFETKALDILDKAIAGGFTDSMSVQRTPDLADLHTNSRFQGVIERLEPSVALSGVWAGEGIETRLVQSDKINDVLSQLRPLLSEQWRPMSVAVQAGTEAPKTFLLLQRPLISDEDIESLALQQAAAAVALLRLNAVERVWPLLQDSPDPRVRSHILHRLERYGHTALGGMEILDMHARTLQKQLAAESSIGRRRALIQGLGEIGSQQGLLTDEERDALLADLLLRYSSDPDPGIHAMCEWTLRRFNQVSHEVEKIKQQFGQGVAIGDRRWYYTKTGSGTFDPGNPIGMAIVDGRQEFCMGTSPPNSVMPWDSLHRRRIDRVFAIGMQEITVHQFREFRPGHEFSGNYKTVGGNIPANTVSWYDAAAYCNWLSEQEGIPRDQWCYEPDQAFEDGMQIRSNYLSLEGYRLPTEAEWEYACRSGTTSSSFFGGRNTRLDGYGLRFDVYERNPEFAEVDSLRPNGFGMFGMYGNATEWCQDAEEDYPIFQKFVLDTEQAEYLMVGDEHRRILRSGVVDDAFGGHFGSHDRSVNFPNRGGRVYGFRVARTYHLRY